MGKEGQVKLCNNILLPPGTGKEKEGWYYFRTFFGLAAVVMARQRNLTCKSQISSKNTKIKKKAIDPTPTI